MLALIRSALDPLSAFVELLMVSSVSVPVLQFVGIVIIAFLLGLLLGRVTKRGTQHTVEHSHEREANRVPLDFGRLTPLGPSEEEASEHSAMDLSGIRPDQAPQDPPTIDLEKQQGLPPGVR